MLAATDKSSQLFGEVLPWLLLLLGVIVAGGVIIYIARRRINVDSTDTTGGFTLHDLRELHKAGEMSDEEYARAKAQMIGRAAAGNADPSAASIAGSIAGATKGSDEPPTSGSADASPGNPHDHPQ